SAWFRICANISFSDLFLSLGEGPISGEDLTLSHGLRGRAPGGLPPAATDSVTALPGTFGEAPLVPLLRFATDQAEISHPELLLLQISPARYSRIAARLGRGRGAWASRDSPKE